MNLQEKIINRLHEIEKEHDIKILFACESGSRAWGFASPDSDYDIRFVYKRKKETYLSLREYNDTLEFAILEDLDFSGWDMKKFLQHFAKSNGVMFEWLQSPIVYYKSGNFPELCLSMMNAYFIPRATMHHYLGLAKKTYFEIKENSNAKIKKYFYVLRPLLAAIWIYKYETIPAMEFQKLIDKSQISDAFKNEIYSLKILKEKSDESVFIKRLELLEKMIDEQLSICEEMVGHQKNQHNDLTELNNLFYSIVMDAE
jgi:predicted nucleotidyltransferase